MKRYGAKKYELTNLTIEDQDSSGRTIVVHRIRSLRSFKVTKWVCGKEVVAEVRIGDLGGYVEKEENLSHSGKAWVDDIAVVFGDAEVSDNAWVGGYALVHDRAKVYGSAKVRDTRICGHTEVRDNAVVDKAGKKIKGSTLIHGNMYVSSNS